MKFISSFINLSLAKANVLFKRITQIRRLANCLIDRISFFIILLYFQ